MQGPDPVWLTRSRLNTARIPAGLRPLLFAPGSLTRLLEQRHGRRPRVWMIGQRWERPLPEEQRLLSLPQGRYMLIREVRLDCGDTPCVYARTLLPAAVRHGAARRFATMGDRPMGTLLFSPRIAAQLQREHRDFARVTRGSTLHTVLLRAQADAPGDVWARRSVYRLQSLRLGIIEIFLPAATDS